MAAPAPSESVEVKPSECSICMSKPSDHIIVPCGHQCGCSECLIQLKQSGGKCPMCRGPINIIQKVYASHNVVINKKKNDELWPEDVKDEDDDDNDNDDDNDDDKKNDDDDDDIDDISIRIAPATYDKNSNIQNIVLKLSGSEKSGRCPVDICAVLDTSGSMCSSAAVQEDDGTVKNDDGLSILDCVKHSVKTVINCLTKNDRFSIVSFDSNAKLQYGLNYMTKTNIKHAINALSRLQPGGQTNLWSGLRSGLESLRINKDNNNKRLSVIMLLTDGRPTVIPPKGHNVELTNYMDEHDLSVQINTFGFGYDLDSELLHSLAVNGSGTFAFIPDAKIVGTTFVNSVSNVLTTIFPETKLYLTPMNGNKFIGKSYGVYSEQDESWGRVIHIGPIMCGATRYISVPIKIANIDNNNKALLECKITNKQNVMIKTLIAMQQDTVCGDLLAGHLTAKTVSIGLEATSLAVKRKGNAAMKLLSSFTKQVENAANIAKNMKTNDFDQMTANDRLAALNNDVQGRFSKAFRGETRFNRWGKHYLRALLRAHQLNLCTNFMDPGLQVNGGNLFRELRAKGDEVFINLPPPKPSRRTGPTPKPKYNYNNYTAPQQPQRQQPAQPDMNNYYAGASGGCFAPHCTVMVMENINNTKQCIERKISDVRPGDMVKVSDAGILGFAEVILMVELQRDIQRRMIKFQSGLVITGGHPVRRNGFWCLPREQSDAQIVEGCDTVFAFVLDKSHVIIVNGMECITWGHGLNDHGVNHSFFGTDKVIQNLREKTMGETYIGESGESVDPLNNVIAIYQ